MVIVFIFVLDQIAVGSKFICDLFKLISFVGLYSGRRRKWMILFVLIDIYFNRCSEITRSVHLSLKVFGDNSNSRSNKMIIFSEACYLAFSFLTFILLYRLILCCEASLLKVNEIVHPRNQTLCQVF